MFVAAAWTFVGTPRVVVVVVVVVVVEVVLVVLVVVVVDVVLVVVVEVVLVVVVVVTAWTSKLSIRRVPVPDAPLARILISSDEAGLSASAGKVRTPSAKDPLPGAMVLAVKSLNAPPLRLYRTVAVWAPVLDRCAWK